MADAMKQRQDSEFEENVISIDRVSRVVKGGRRFRFRALVVVGDKKSKVGIGVSKGSDVQMAVSKAVDDAKKNMIEVPVTENGTIPHQIQARSTGAKILLKPASSGTGLIAGGTVRSVIEVSGITNILSKSLGSNNKINVAYATLKALSQLEPKENWVTTSNEPKKPAKKSSTKKKATSKSKEGK